MIEKLNTIGNTQLIKINYEYNGKEKYIYAKLEYYNLTGSIKDRVAYYIIKNAYKRRELIENKPIIEATSGNTGISISALGKGFLCRSLDEARKYSSKNNNGKVLYY